MARSVDTIYNQITAALVAAFGLIGITLDPTQWSRRNLLGLISYNIATAISTFEQLNDQLKVDIENVADTLPPQTERWIQAQALKFQYNADNPQILQLNEETQTYYYPDENADYQIVKYCSVNGVGGVVAVKVAAAGPTALPSGPTSELAAFQSYIKELGVTGITLTAISLDADEIYIKANIYYVAQYSAIIQDNVIAAINTFLGAIPFNGKLQKTDLEIAIRNVEGVNDVVLQTVRARRATDTFPAGTVLVNDFVEIQRNYQTIAGYIIPETTSGSELTDTLTFIPE